MHQRSARTAALASSALLAGTLVAFTGTSPATAATVRQEAETSPAVCTGTIDSDWTGFSGTGFCNGTNSTSGYAQFTVNAAVAGTATLNIRFANGTSAARPASLAVNGTTVQTPSFEATGAWSTWVTKTLTVTLNAGSNTIRLTPTTSEGLPNVDYAEATTTDSTTPPATGAL
ncbi:carbohydrate-binding protein, partial [Kribbella solani]